MKRIANTQGFTLIEIVFSLIILGVLGTLVAQHYFDLREETERKLAKATVDAAQVKINSRFTRYMAQGDSCTSAVDKVKTLQQISDDGKSQFGEFELSIASGVGDVITSQGVSITATSLSSKRKFQDIALLEVPKCVEISFPEIDVTPDDPAIPDNPTGPKEDLKFGEMLKFVEAVADDPKVKWGQGLVFLDEETGDLYIWVSGNKSNTHKDINFLLNKGDIVKVGESYSTYDTTTGEWTPQKNGSLRKESVDGQESVSVYVEKDSKWVTVYTYKAPNFGDNDKIWLPLKK